MSKSRFLAIVMCVIIVFSCMATMAVSAAGTVESGNANGDSVVNILDLIRLKKYLSGMDVEIDFAGADCDDDGFVGNSDLIILRKTLLEIEDTFQKPIDLPDVDLVY